MATDKPDLSRIWASAAPSGNVVDPDDTTPGKFNAGWQAEVPPFEHFNFLQKLFSQGLVYNNEQGINEWDVATTYPNLGLSKGSNGVIYQSQQEQTGNDPISDNGANWIVYNPLSEFGIGGDAIEPTTGNDMDNIAASGFYKVASAATNAQFAPGTIIHIERETNGATQVNFDIESSAMSIRAKNSVGVWQPWLAIGEASVTLAVDMDSISTNGAYYTDATTANRINTVDLGVSDVIFDHLQIDANNAIQRAVDPENNVSFFRGKFSGTWQPWQIVTTNDIDPAGWPVIIDENSIDVLDVSTTSGWTGDTGSLSTNGSSLTLTASGTGTAREVDKATVSPVSGDYIFYATLRAGGSTAGSSANFQLGGSGDGRLIVSLGYNWETSNYEAGRVSARVGGIGIQGPTVDYVNNDVDVAVQYDSRLGVGNLFIRESGAWVFYGGATFADPFRSVIQMSTGGGDNDDAIIKSLMTARPNAAVIGDSIAAGHTLYDPDPSFYVGDDNYLSTWMATANVYGSLTNNLIVNYGVGGQNSAEIDARVNTMLTNTSAKVVFLHASSNDYGDSVPDATRTANIQASVDKIRAAGAKAILLNAVYPNSGSAGHPANADYYRNWWNTYSADISGANLKIDIMADTGILDGNYMNATFTQADGVHPNVTGFALIGNYIETLEP